MNFFKSVFSDDPDPPRSKTESESPTNAPQSKEEEAPVSGHRSDVNPTSDDSSGGGWNFGGLLKTLTSKSETIIETYRRDLKEFGSGLRKEIEVAQGSLETVGHAIDEFGNTVVKETAQIISQGKEAILAANLESESNNNNDNNQQHGSEKSLNLKPYTRFDAQVSAIQTDASTYCEEPEDLNDYKKWKLEFSLEGKNEEIESFLRANDAMESIYKTVVPNSVDHETFWCRYYYKVHKLKKAEDVRAKLVRGMSKEEEDLSWDFEDDDDKDHGSKAKPNLVTSMEIGGEDLGKRAGAYLQAGSSAVSNEAEIRRPNMEEGQNFSVEMEDNVIQDKEQGNKTDNSFEELKAKSSEVVNETGEKSCDVDNKGKESIKVAETGEKSCDVDNKGKESIKEADIDKASKSDGDTIVKKNGPVGKSNEEIIVEGKAADGKSSNEDEEDEDLGWDEIEDLSSIDEKKATQSRSMDKIGLRKRLSAAEEEEDLSWDIEDDEEEEPAKA